MQDCSISSVLIINTRGLSKIGDVLQIQLHFTEITFLYYDWNWDEFFFWPANVSVSSSNCLAPTDKLIAWLHQTINWTPVDWSLMEDLWQSPEGNSTTKMCLKISLWKI